MADPNNIYDIPITSVAKSGFLDPVLSFGNPNMSLDEIKRRRAIAAALAARRRDFPKTIGEGMTYFGESLADAFETIQLGRGEKAYNERFERESAPVRDSISGVASPVAAATETVTGNIASSLVPGSGLPPPGAVPSPLPPAPAGPMAGGPLVTRNASMDTGDTGATVFDGPNPPIITNEIKPMQMAQAGSLPGRTPAGPPAAPLRPSAAPGGTLAPVIPEDPGPMPQPSVRNDSMTKTERDAWTLWQRNQQEPRAKMLFERAHEQGQRERDAAWKRQEAIDNLKLKDWERRKTAHESAVTSAPKTQIELDKGAAEATAAQAKEAHRRTYGDLPDPVSKVLDASKEKAAMSVTALEAVRDARQAMPHAVFGAGATIRLAPYQAAAVAGNEHSKRVVEASQTFQSNMGPLIQQLVKGLAGKDVSKQELEFIRSIAGGNLALDRNSAERIINIAERTSNANLKEHRETFDTLVKGQHPDALPSLQSIYGVREPAAAGMPLSSAGTSAADTPIVDVASEADAIARGVKRFRLPSGRTGRIE